jgi:hypothetical protein
MAGGLGVASEGFAHVRRAGPYFHLSGQRLHAITLQREGQALMELLGVVVVVE